MEYFPRGDLQSYINNMPRPLAEQEVSQVAYQIAEGLKIMHENGFVHRDIKPAVSVSFLIKFNSD
jgi:calcium/calmodulin-dependent protein kinase I